ncbi:Flp family type IVb pilin [Serratia sp. NA_112.1]|uniref:Flp family type IVb pilin n=1 Tax=unclassified Serratia (in: enterobacteria) TaxID=2647522 RepID=UPI004046DA80
MNNCITKIYASTQLRIKNFVNDQLGVTAIEYALIGVAMATLLAFIFGDQNSGFLGALNETFQAITAAIKSVTISKS